MDWLQKFGSFDDFKTHNKERLISQIKLEKNHKM